MENNLIIFPKGEVFIFGNWDEVSEATKMHVDALATSRARARVAEPQVGLVGGETSCLKRE